MPVFATNGSTIAICETAQTSEPANAAAYQALTWVPIGEVESLGTFGTLQLKLSSRQLTTVGRAALKARATLAFSNWSAVSTTAIPAKPP